ncbi:hypothetical protein CR492_15370 [Methylocella silvestris]|uniref:Uncharacterized protein n=1 Tax=Methylocella silvestris TaxID=199596 RepID=A0A2J7TE52_METSI|nr:hypothetical protein CR492_15370 [Methylocella silvestris]
MAQACFLGATLGPDAVWMIGDSPALAAERICLFPSTHPLPETERFGLILNVDSITEMGASASARYAEWIAKRADVFLSINHEANAVTVADLASRFFPSADSRRVIYWMRHGYAEEVFRF